MSLFQEATGAGLGSDPNTSSNESDDVSSNVLTPPPLPAHPPHLKGECREGHSQLTDNVLLRARLNEQV